MVRNFLLGLFLVVLVAGCTGDSGGFDRNAGAAIKEFSIDITDLVEKEETGIILSVQNVGGKTMPGDSRLWLYGPSFNPENSWKITDSIADAAKTSGLTIETNKFLPPDPERGGEGEIVFTQGTLKYNGDIPEGIPPQEYTFNARLCYPYLTSAATVLKFQSRDEFRISAPKSSKAQTIESAGPIQINLRGSENIRLTNNRMQLIFDIENKGKGNPLAKTYDGEDVNHCAKGPNIDIKDLNKVDVVVTVDGVNACESKTVTIDKTTNKGTMYCTAQVSEDDVANPEHEFHITATANYDYYVTSELVVSVSDGDGDN